MRSVADEIAPAEFDILHEGAVASYKGFGWRYVDDDVAIGDIIPDWDGFSVRRSSKPVLQVDANDGHIIARFESARDAQRLNAKFVASNITAVCKGRLKSCAGYVWKYE